MYVDDRSRSSGAFLRAIRAAPGFWLRVTVTASFALSLWVTEGPRPVLVAVCIGAGVALVVGYPLFRRRGRFRVGDRTVRADALVVRCVSVRELDASVRGLGG